jgi:hypothetical protein
MFFSLILFNEVNAVSVAEKYAENITNIKISIALMIKPLSIFVPFFLSLFPFNPGIGADSSRVYHYITV